MVRSPSLPPAPGDPHAYARARGTALARRSHSCGCVVATEMELRMCPAMPTQHALSKGMALSAEKAAAQFRLAELLLNAPARGCASTNSLSYLHKATGRTMTNKRARCRPTSRHSMTRHRLHKDKAPRRGW